jgi:hypothetical protein
MNTCCASTSTQTVGDARIILDSIITCPRCSTARTERMPLDACQIVYKCGQCDFILRPKAGNCCVYCSYGSVPCPPIQAARL